MRTAIIAALIGVGFIAVGVAASQERQAPTPIAKANPVPLSYTFMQVHVKNKGETDNQKFFVGPLPREGEAVEMVYVGSEPDGAMNFQLRTKR